jgi:hypothetical protein
MSNSCSNVNEVMLNFNKMSDGRAFTDYRSCHEIDIDLFSNSRSFCPSSNNSYDSRVCVQRNTGTILNGVNSNLKNTFDLSRCKKTQSNSCKVIGCGACGN